MSFTDRLAIDAQFEEEKRGEAILLLVELIETWGHERVSRWVSHIGMCLPAERAVSTREYFDTPQTWVCCACRYSEPSRMQIRCPACGVLMQRATS